MALSRTLAADSDYCADDSDCGGGNVCGDWDGECYSCGGDECDDELTCDAVPSPDDPDCSEGCCNDDSTNTDLPDDGTFTLTPDGTVYRMAGCSPIQLSTCHTQGYFPGCSNIQEVSQEDVDTWKLFQPVPGDGTFIRRPEGTVYRFAGSAPVQLYTCDASGYYPGCSGFIDLDGMAVDRLIQAQAVPSNGTLLRKPDGSVYQMRCGRAEYVASCSDVGGCDGLVDVDGMAVDELAKLRGCDDGDPCTADICDEETTCRNPLVVESRACNDCEDGIDNDSDGNFDAEDCACATLCKHQRFAVESSAQVGREPLYAGGVVHINSSIAPENVDQSVAPYPVGASVAGFCGNDMGLRRGLDVGLVATQWVNVLQRGVSLGGGIDIRQEFTSNNRLMSATVDGPLVGPGRCSDDGMTECTQDTNQCVVPANLCCTGAGATCNGRLHFPPNPGGSQSHVDRSGTAETFTRCQAAIDGYCSNDETQLCMSDADCGSSATCIMTLVEDSQAIAGIAGNVAGYGPTDGAKIRTKITETRIITVGGGQQVMEVSSVLLRRASRLYFAGQPDTVLVVRIKGSFRAGGDVIVGLQGGLRADHVLWNIEGRSLWSVKLKGVNPGTYVSSFDTSLVGTFLAPERKGIVLGGWVRLEGALLAPAVHIRGHDTILHEPFTQLLQ